MRKRLIYGMVLTLSLSLMSAMCSSDDDATPSNSQDIAQVENTATAGTWRVTSFIDSGVDETNDFNGYQFTFNTNGALIASNGTTTYNGTWSVSNDDSDDDSSSNDDLEFNIFFPVPDTNDFEDLNDDWDIVNYTSTVINLIDISGGNGDTDTLTFERN